MSEGQIHWGIYIDVYQTIKLYGKTTIKLKRKNENASQTRTTIPVKMYST